MTGTAVAKTVGDVGIIMVQADISFPEAKFRSHYMPDMVKNLIV